MIDNITEEQRLAERKVNHQNAFDKVWKHFVVEKNLKSVSINQKCVYRADYTAECKTRCAIGVLIPDELYSPGFDSGSFGLAGVLKKVKLEDNLSFSFAHSLQRCHDGTYSGDFHVEIKKNLTHLAYTYDLIIPNDNPM